MFKEAINKVFYKANNKEIYWEKIISFTVVIVGLSILAIVNTSTNSNREKERDSLPIYTIGVTREVRKANYKASPFIIYQYRFGNIKYSQTQSWAGGYTSLPPVGARFSTRLAFNNPGNSELLDKFPAPDSIVEIPDSGWRNIVGIDEAK